jgi:hypothetical protein
MLSRQGIWQKSTSFTAEESFSRDFITILFEFMRLLGSLKVILIEEFI